MKRKRSSSRDCEEVDTNIMVKCVKFIFDPKDNKVVNFCHSFGEAEKTEKSEETRIVVITPEDSNSGTPDGSQSVTKLSSVITENAVESSAPVILQIEKRPSTPQTQTPQDQNQFQVDGIIPTSPEEVKKLRDMKISNGRYVVNQTQLLEIRRKELELAEEKKSILEHSRVLEGAHHRMMLFERECAGRFEWLMQRELAFRQEREREIEMMVTRMLEEREMMVRREMSVRIRELEEIVARNGDERGVRCEMVPEPINIQQRAINILNNHQQPTPIQADQIQQQIPVQQFVVNSMNYNHHQRQQKVIAQQAPIHTQAAHDQQQQKVITQSNSIQAQQQQNTFPNQVQPQAQQCQVQPVIDPRMINTESSRGRTREREVRNPTAITPMPIPNTRADVPPVISQHELLGQARAGVLTRSQVMAQQIKKNEGDGVLVPLCSKDVKADSDPNKAKTVEEIQAEMLALEDKRKDAFSLLKTIPNVFNLMFGKPQ